jgi:hypothetical protein
MVSGDGLDVGNMSRGKNIGGVNRDEGWRAVRAYLEVKCAWFVCGFEGWVLSCLFVVGIHL